MDTSPGIRTRREALRLTQFQVAAAGRISLPTIQKAERLDQWPPQSRTRLALARALGLTVDPLTGQALPERAGIPIDTPAQARAVLAERGITVPPEA